MEGAQSRVTVLGQRAAGEMDLGDPLPPALAKLLEWEPKSGEEKKKKNKDGLTSSTLFTVRRCALQEQAIQNLWQQRTHTFKGTEKSSIDIWLH